MSEIETLLLRAENIHAKIVLKDRPTNRSVSKTIIFLLLQVLIDMDQVPVDSIHTNRLLLITIIQMTFPRGLSPVTVIFPTDTIQCGQAINTDRIDGNLYHLDLIHIITENITELIPVNSDHHINQVLVTLLTDQITT